MKQTYSPWLSRRLTRPLAALALLLATAGAAQAQSTLTFTGALTATDPTIPGDRLLRDGTPSACGTNKTYPGTTFGAGVHYDTYTFSASSATCVTVTLVHNCTEATAAQLFGSAYTGSFTASNLSLNYKGDTGTSPQSGTDATMGLTVAPGQPVVLVVSGLTGTSACSSYTLTASAAVPLSTNTAPALTTINPASGPVGTSVTLTGSNLSGATAVTFAGTSNNTVTTGLTVSGTGSSQTLTVAVPAGATTGPVTVTTPGGGTSNGLTFTVVASAPVLAAIETSVLPYNSSQAPAQITGALTVRDADSPNLTGATVAISSGLAFGDRLNFINQNGISGTYTFNTGVLVLNGSAPVATYQAALRSITFATLGSSAGVAGDRVVSFSISDGTNASNQVARTIRVVGQPAVATVPPSGLTSTSAVLGGNVSADGGDAVTDRGVVYSLATNSASPTISIGLAGVTQDRNGTGLGSYSKTIGGLTPGTSYYARAYATNTAGTSYGTPLGFTTAAAVSGTAAVTNVSCYAGSNGAIDLTPTGGVPPYSYRWNDGPTTQDRTNLPAGTYAVTITDAAGATGTVSNIIVSQPTSLTSTAAQTNIACNGGSEGVATVSASGGTSPYTYRWSTGATTPTITGLTAGSYSVSITDANGCMTSRTIVIVQPAALTATTSQTNVTTTGGSNGSATITVSGGSPNYTYEWTLSVSTSATATGLRAGTYFVTATDARGCTITRSFTISQPAATVASAQPVTVQLDANGNGTLNASSVNNGSTGSGTLTYTIQKIAFGYIPESTTPLTLTTPNGANFTQIRFASYGTPNNSSSGNYTLGSCNAANSLAAAQNAYVGRSTGTLYASNTDTRNNPVLGDPCGGTPKALAVQAAYSANDASLAYDCTEAGKTQYVLLTVTNGTTTSTAVAQVTVAAPPTATLSSVSPLSAQRGATVTVAGTNLSGVSSVTVNGATATVSNLSSTGFTFVVPGTATFGPGSLVVITPCAQALTSPFTVVAPALLATVSTTAASPTSTAPVPFAVSFSQSVGSTFTASDVTVAGGTLTSGSFSGSGAGPYTFTVTPSGTGTVSVSLAASVATDANNTPNTASNTLSVQYQQPVTTTPVLTSPANNSTTATTTPTYQGTAVAGSTVTVFVNNTSIGTTTATGGGTFSLTQPTALAQGTYSVYATAQASGQTASANSNTNTFTVATAPTITAFSPASGPVGTQVTITGTNLSGATAVSFNGTPASSFVVNSATSLTAVVAAGTTAGPVRVSTPGGTATSATSFVVRIAPITVADTYTTPQNTTLTGNVLTNDLGTNPRAILIIRPTNGTLLLNPDGTFTYQPNAGFVGTDSFLYYACDPALPLLCGNPATVTINVVRVAPVTVADAYTSQAGVTLTGNVLTNDIGTNPQAILIIRPTRGTLLLNPNGTFTYQPNPGFTGTDSFIYYACNQGAPLVCGDPATVTITVRPANTATRSANPNAAKPSATTPLAGAAQELTLTGSPNPFSQELRVQFALPTAQAYTLAVYDAQGRLVQQLARGQAEAGQAQELVVPTQTYATGLYLLRLTTPSGTQLLKLIKQ